MDRARGAKVEAYGIARVRGRAAPLATVALLHVPLVGVAILHAQGPRSAQ